MKKIKIRLYFLFICCIVFYTYSCKRKVIEKETLEEHPIPYKILDRYLKLISLDTITGGVKKFEVRKWYPFTSDSFPVVLERFYVEDNMLRGEIYLFHTKNHFSVTKGTQLDSLAFEKISIQKLPIRFLDSLQEKYNLFSIKGFDTKVFEEMNHTGMIMAQPALILLEQSSEVKYKATFITNPKLYSWKNNSISKYTDFFNFTSDSLSFYFPENKKWFDENVDKILVEKN